MNLPGVRLTHISGLLEPGNRIGDGLAIGSRGVSKLSPGLRVVEEHVMARHAQTVSGRERLLSSQVSEPFGAERNGIERGNGKSQRRSAASDDFGDVREHGAQTHVLPAQNIPLSDSTA